MFEKLNSNTESVGEENPGENAPAPSFDEHMMEHHPRTPEQRLQRFMEMSGIKETRANNEEFDEALRELDPEKAYNILSHMNVILRGEKLHERGRADDVTVGEHVAPAEEIQMEVIKDAVEALGTIEDSRYRAALGYFVVNGLHLFPDGNGRTSRAVYEILDDPEFDLASEDSLRHHGVGEAYGHGKFEREKGIASAETALSLALWYVKHDMVASGEISKKFGDCQTNLAIIYNTEPEIYLTDEARRELPDEEKRAINRAFMDGDIALIALAKILTEKGTYDEVAEACTHVFSDEDKVVQIEVMEGSLDRYGEKNELAPKTFAGWKAEDYRRVVRLIGDVQRLQYKNLIAVFTSPDDHKYRDGRRVADRLVGRH